MFGGLSPAPLCMTWCCVASCFQFRTWQASHNIDLGAHRDTWREGQQLHLREPVRIGQ